VERYSVRTPLFLPHYRQRLRIQQQQNPLSVCDPSGMLLGKTKSAWHPLPVLEDV